MHLLLCDYSRFDVSLHSMFREICAHIAKVVYVNLIYDHSSCNG